MAAARTRKFSLIVCACTLLIVQPRNNASAVPSFARQTGMECSSCHTVYPELNSFGRHFKIMGYTMSKSTKPYQWPPPLAGVVKAAFTHIDKDLPPGSVNDTWANMTDATRNDVLYLPKIVGVYYAGRIYGGLGALVQGNYSGIEDGFSLDITDIRYARMTADRNFMYGITINNAPTLGDPWNSTPAWGFPYESSDVAPTPAANPLIEGELQGQQVGGAGLYVLYKDTLYVQGAAYRTNLSGITSPLGAGTETTTVVDDAMPYWRVALTHKWGNHALEAGTYGLAADVYPQGLEQGPTNHFKDIGFDAQYQYVTGKHTFSIAGAWVHEKQDWDASFALGDTSNTSDDLAKFRTNVNYFYRAHLGSIGGTVSYFLIDGDEDRLLYGPDPVDGSRTGSPDSSGFILEGDFVLDYRHKLALQYVIYDKFNGSHSDYDGFGRNASDNDTLYLLLQFMI